MSKKDRLKGRLAAYVASLSEEEARDQLVRAFLHMERCISVLEGKPAVPVKMKDNGLNSELELFWRCVKAAEEVEYYKEEMESGDFALVRGASNNSGFFIGGDVAYFTDRYGRLILQKC